LSKKDKPFHNPFADAQAKLKQLVAPAPEKSFTKRALEPPKAPPPTRDENLFEDEMAGVAPLAPDPRGRVGAPETAHVPRPSKAARDEAEAYASLADLVDGGGTFDISDGDEFIEGIAPGLDRRILKRLKKGDYALQGHVDLHGMTKEEARAAVDQFITESRAHGRRCVLIIHGRGHNSKDQIPILKERVKTWLERGRLARSVLAFCTARPCDGGQGAVYVLLRK
jgi:DNA-nicking Smr family endonuclease